MSEKAKKQYDVVILGGGPAGLSAAIYAARGNAKTAIIDISMFGGQPSNYLELENYPALGKIGGYDMMEKFEEHADMFNVDKYPMQEIDKIDLQPTIKTIETKEAIFETKTVIIATGAQAKKLGIPGEQEFIGRGVSYCAVCDAFFFRGKDVAVLGSGNYAFHEAEYLKNVAGRVTLLTNGENNGEISSFEVIDTKISHLEGADRIESVVFEDGNKLSIDGLFVAQGFAGASELANKLGVMCENGNIIADQNGYTNLPGCFAAGDCIGGILQVSTAVGEGAKAALSAIKYIRSK